MPHSQQEMQSQKKKKKHKDQKTSINNQKHHIELLNNQKHIDLLLNVLHNLSTQFENKQKLIAELELQQSKPLNKQQKKQIKNMQLLVEKMQDILSAPKTPKKKLNLLNEQIKQNEIKINEFVNLNKEFVNLFAQVNLFTILSLPNHTPNNIQEILEQLKDIVWPKKDKKNFLLVFLHKQNDAFFIDLINQKILHSLHDPILGLKAYRLIQNFFKSTEEKEDLKQIQQLFEHQYVEYCLVQLHQKFNKIQQKLNINAKEENNEEAENISDEMLQQKNINDEEEKINNEEEKNNEEKNLKKKIVKKDDKFVNFLLEKMHAIQTNNTILENIVKLENKIDSILYDLEEIYAKNLIVEVQKKMFFFNFKEQYQSTKIKIEEIKKELNENIEKKLKAKNDFLSNFIENFQKIQVFYPIYADLLKNLDKMEESGNKILSKKITAKKRQIKELLGPETAKQIQQNLNNTLLNLHTTNISPDFLQKLQEKDTSVSMLNNLHKKNIHINLIDEYIQQIIEKNIDQHISTPKKDFNTKRDKAKSHYKFIQSIESFFKELQTDDNFKKVEKFDKEYLQKNWSIWHGALCNFPVLIDIFQKNIEECNDLIKNFNFSELVDDFSVDLKKIFKQIELEIFKKEFPELATKVFPQNNNSKKNQLTQIYTNIQEQGNDDALRNFIHQKKKALWKNIDIEVELYPCDPPKNIQSANQ